jgi:hypothetical protein
MEYTELGLRERLVLMKYELLYGINNLSANIYSVAMLQEYQPREIKQQQRDYTIFCSQLDFNNERNSCIIKDPLVQTPC